MPSPASSASRFPNDGPGNPHRKTLCHAQGRAPRGAGDFRHRRRSGPGNVKGNPFWFTRGWRRPDRTRHAVLGPDGRRPGHPGQFVARAEERPDAEKDAGFGHRVPTDRQRHPGGADGLLQPHLHPRGRCLRRRGPGGRRRRADHRRPAAGRSGRAVAASAGRRHRFHLPDRTDVRRCPAAGDRQACVGIHLLRFHHRHHRHALG